MEANIYQGMPNIVQFLPCLIMYILINSRKIISDQLFPSPFPVSLQSKKDHKITKYFYVVHI
jgi:hypothetical protein